MTKDSLVLVNSYTSPIEANIAKNSLEAEGIPAFVFDEHSIGVNPWVANALGGVKVMVRQQDLNQAIEVLKAIENNPSTDEEGVPVHCPACNSDNINVYNTKKSSKKIIGIITAFIAYFYPTNYLVFKCEDCQKEFPIGK